MNGKKVNVKRESAVVWHWLPPDATLDAKAYGAAIMRDVRKYAKRPEALATYVRYEGELRPGSYHDDFTIEMVVNQGSGWGGTREVPVASWQGGNRWLLSGDYRGNASLALNRLRLPEVDGRYLLIGAPPKPAKGVTAWRNRWTVSRAHLRGLIAVAGAGIDPRQIRLDLEQTRSGALVTAQMHLDNAQKARDQLAALPPLADVLAAAERVKERLALIGITPEMMSEGQRYSYSYSNSFASRVEYASNERNALRKSDPTTGSERVKEEAARLLYLYSEADETPLRIGVRATLPNGCPRSDGPFKDPMVVGVPATAPDWNPGAHCGNGLHYIPRHTGEGPQEVHRCVKYALSYTSQDEFALWIVRAENVEHSDDVIDAVMIDGHKGKAQTLTPIAYCGRYGGGKRLHTRIITTLKLAETARNQRDELAQRIRQHERTAASNKALAERTATTLRDWRKG